MSHYKKKHPLQNTAFLPRTYTAAFTRTLALVTVLALPLSLPSCTSLQNNLKASTVSKEGYFSQSTPEENNALLEVTEYDSQERPVKVYRDYNHDGKWDEVSLGSYDAQGIMNHVEVDYNNDGIADEICTENYEGMILRKVTYQRYDETDKTTHRLLIEMIDTFDQEGNWTNSETILPQKGIRETYLPQRNSVRRKL